jgi:hypothetical protein
MTDPVQPQREEPLDAPINPYQPPASAGMPSAESQRANQNYNLVSDTVTGVNVRLRDNVVQALAILVCLLLGAAIGALVAGEIVPGVLLGGFVGMLVGLFSSGIFLMIYRAVLHLRGRHD